MSDRFHELRTARREGVQPLHRSNISNQMSDRFHELRTARREGRPLYQPNTSKKRDDATKESNPGFRYRRPTPHHIEHNRHDGVSEPYPKGDSPLIDALRGRSRSSPPPRTRAPTPHPRASGPRMTQKTVRWADPLEQPTPEKIGSEGKRRDSGTPKEDAEESPNEDQHCTLRRHRASSIPRPRRNGLGQEVSKRRLTPIVTISVKLASQAHQSPQRPLSPLIPQAMPAPLRLSPIKTSTHRAVHTIPSSVSAPVVQTKSATRDFSFENQPEIITLSPDCRPPQQHHVSQSAHEEPSPSKPTSFSYLKEKPRRRGTLRPRPSDTKPAPTAAESSKPPLPSSSSTSSFHSAKNFSSDIDGGGKNHDSSSKPMSPTKPVFATKPVSPIEPGPGPGPSDMTLDAVDRASSSPCKLPVPALKIPSSAPSSSFHAAKNFWNGISTSSSCGAIIDGSEDVKPVCGPSAVADREKLCKTSKVAELSGYTVNRPVNDPSKAQSSISRIPIPSSKTGFGGRDQAKSKIPVPSTSSYHVTKTQQSRYVPLRAVVGVSASRSSLKPPAGGSSSVSGSSNTSSYRTANTQLSVAGESNASASDPKTSILSSNDLVQAEHTPTLQSQLWHDVMKLCTSDSSSCPQYCDCDDCMWSGKDEVARCSTVAHVDDGKCRRR